MTREEAIKLLSKLRETIDRNNAYGEAEEMGIQALEQEPCEDAISRQAVLDMWRKIICYDRTCPYRDEGRCTETFCDFKLFEYEINHMPPVKPQPCEDANANQHNSNALNNVGQHTNALDAISRQALLDDFGLSEKTRKWGGDHSGYNTMMLYEIQDMIESAPPINPQPCEDAINRERAKKQIGRWIGYIDQDMINRICMSLDALPPVKPQYTDDEIQKMQDLEQAEIQKAYELGQADRPTGHWIEQIDHEENCRTLICSNCDRPALHDEDSIWKHKFCPHCGCKMVEPQERSDKE